MTIVKRDGRKMPFEKVKIALALHKAAIATGEFDDKEAQRLAGIAAGIIEKVIVVRKEPVTVEQVQDTVEQVLMAAGHFKTAKAYILYRAEHAKIRKAETVIGVENDLNLDINQLKVIERRYLVHDQDGKPMETPGQMFRRVAKTLAGVEKKNKKIWEEKFYDVMTNFEFLPGGRTLNNAGTLQNQLANCFVIPVEDSMEGIFDAVKWTALVHRTGGGTGFNFSLIRPSGDAVTKSSGGFATGPVSFMKVFDIATRQVMQGGKQRGANMGILAVHHPDILEFITCKSEEGEISNFNISVGTTDAFMRAVEKDKEFGLINPRTNKPVQNISARMLMDQIVSLAWRTGDPGMIYWDAINRNNPLLDSVGPIYATNPCITGDAHIPTSRGLLRFEDLYKRYGKNMPIEAAIRSGEQYQGKIVATYDQGEKEIIEIITRHGYRLKATPDHKIMTPSGWVQAKELKGKAVLLQSKEGVWAEQHTLSMRGIYPASYPTQWSRELGQVLGWLVGDGWVRNPDSAGKDIRVGWTFGERDIPVLKTFLPRMNTWYGSSVKPVKRGKTVTHLSYHGKAFTSFFLELGISSEKAGHKIIPASLFMAPKEAVVGFLQGLFGSDGTVGYQKSKQNAYIRLTSKSITLLQQTQLFLANMGIVSTLYDRSRKQRKNQFAYTNKSGEQRGYTTDGILWELNISSSNIRTFIQKIGFLNNRYEKKLQSILAMNLREERFEDTVVEVRSAGKERVYDLTEEVSHSFIANGIVVANCGEQPLHPFDSCNLGSINLSSFAVKDKKTGRTTINWNRLATVTATATRMLDNVIDACTYPLPQITKTVHQHRRIGLGVMGWADLLLQLNIPYNSDEGVALAKKIMKHVQESSWDASEQLAKEKGAFPQWKNSWFAKGYDPVTHTYVHKKKPRKFRNVAITTIAPTGTISMAADCSSGIEPIFALSYVKNVVDAAGLTYINKYFERALKEHAGSNGEFNAIVAEVTQTGGVQHSATVPLNLKRVFVTSHDIDWQWHVRMQAAFQDHTDNAVSKTINFPANATLEDIRGAYLLAWKLGCKGITVYRDTSKATQVLSVQHQTTPSSIDASAPKKSHQIMQSQHRVTPLVERQDFSALTKQEVLRDDIVDVPEEGEKCPDCGALMQNQEGCNLCLQCGYSKCKL